MVKSLIKESLEEQENILHAITASVRDAIIMINNDGNISFWNEASSGIFGFSRDEAIGKNLHELIVPKKFLNQHKQAFPLFQLSGAGTAIGKILELLAIRKDGTEFPIELSLSSLRIDNKWCAIGIVRDITDKKNAENTLKKREEKYRKIFENVQDVFLQTDLEGKIVEISPSIERYSFYSREELIGKSAEKIYANPARRQELIKELSEKGEVFDFELILKSKKKREIWASLSAHKYYDQNGKLLGIEGSLRDISKRKKAEFKVEKQAEELKQLNATKDKFFSIIAHDLINPFQAILGLSSLLIENYNEYGQQEIEEMLNDIESSSKRAYALLENLLIWGRSQTNLIKFQPENIDLKEIVADNLALIKSQSNKKHLHVRSEINTPCFAFADKNMIDTVIRNLITNATKFTPQYGEIVISARKQDKKIEVSVKDTGVGMSARQRDNIFRIDSKMNTPGTENETGSGLGLILCKDFVEKNGGKILVESEEGKGSTFRFTLPLRDQNHYGTGI